MKYRCEQERGRRGRSDAEQGAGRVDAGNVVDDENGNYPPAAEVSVSDTRATTDDTVDLDGSGSTDSDGSISSYEWDFGDGSTATGETVSHSYDANAEYTVTLTVTDDAGTTDSASVTVTDSDFYCGTATNSDHVDAGRAYYSGGCYYAEGSSEYLGCISTTETTLKETSEGYYEEVPSC